LRIETQQHQIHSVKQRTVTNIARDLPDMGNAINVTQQHIISDHPIPDQVLLSGFNISNPLIVNPSHCDRLDTRYW
jgi:hypothetical protein